jgi:aldose 1-epimerase
MKLSPELPPAEVLAIRAGRLVLELVPAIGGAIAGFYLLRDDGWRFDWLRPATPEAIRNRVVEAMASFPLIPFCNRIRNGRATFEGRAIAMPPNRGASPHTIHGTAWQAPWRVAEHGVAHAVLELDSPAGVWPYHFHATQRFALSAERVAVTIEVENRDSVPMPLGVGHHPYLPHRRGTMLQTDVDRIWLGDAEVMPTGLAATPVVEQLRRGAVLKDIVADNNFTGWRRQARVTWPDAGPNGDAALTLEAEPPLDYFVLYSPADMDHFCIEPVSNCTDWLNLQGYPHDELGGAVVAPGDRYCATFYLTPHPSDQM